MNTNKEFYDKLETHFEELKNEYMSGTMEQFKTKYRVANKTLIGLFGKIKRDSDAYKESRRKSVETFFKKACGNNKPEFLRWQWDNLSREEFINTYGKYPEYWVKSWELFNIKPEAPEEKVSNIVIEQPEYWQDDTVVQTQKAFITFPFKIGASKN